MLARKTKVSTQYFVFPKKILFSSSICGDWRWYLCSLHCVVFSCALDYSLQYILARMRICFELLPTPPCTPAADASCRPPAPGSPHLKQGCYWSRCLCFSRWCSGTGGARALQSQSARHHQFQHQVRTLVCAPSTARGVCPEKGQGARDRIGQHPHPPHPPQASSINDRDRVGRRSACMQVDLRRQRGAFLKSQHLLDPKELPCLSKCFMESMLGSP